MNQLDQENIDCHLLPFWVTEGISTEKTENIFIYLVII